MHNKYLLLLLLLKLVKKRIVMINIIVGEYFIIDINLKQKHFLYKTKQILISLFFYNLSCLRSPFCGWLKKAKNSVIVSLFLCSQECVYVQGCLYYVDLSAWGDSIWVLIQYLH